VASEIKRDYLAKGVNSDRKPVVLQQSSGLGMRLTSPSCKTFQIPECLQSGYYLIWAVEPPPPPPPAIVVVEVVVVVVVAGAEVVVSNSSHLSQTNTNGVSPHTRFARIHIGGYQRVGQTYNLLPTCRTDIQPSSSWQNITTRCHKQQKHSKNHYRREKLKICTN
jgi:hypothetical protein